MNLIEAYEKGEWGINQKNGAYTPIIDTVYAILYEQKNARKQFQKLTNLID